jgi:hypothetical protein
MSPHFPFRSSGRALLIDPSTFEILQGSQGNGKQK